MNIKNEVKYAVGMMERRQEEAKTIGSAESVRQATMTYRSMAGALREVRRHRDNVLNAIDDKTALEAKEVLALFVTAMDWHYRAGEDLRGFGVTQEQIDNIDREVGI